MLDFPDVLEAWTERSSFLTKVSEGALMRREVIIWKMWVRGEVLLGLYTPTPPANPSHAPLGVRVGKSKTPFPGLRLLAPLAPIHCTGSRWSRCYPSAVVPIRLLLPSGSAQVRHAILINLWESCAAVGDALLTSSISHPESHILQLSSYSMKHYLFALVTVRVSSAQFLTRAFHSFFWTLRLEEL